MKKSTAILGILVAISLALLVVGISKATYGDEPLGTQYTVKLQDGLTITDEMEAKIPSVTGQACWKRYLYNEPCTINIEQEPQGNLVGKIVSSEDGTTCWKVEEKQGVYYYKLMGDCNNG